MKATVRARYYFGQPVARGQLTYVVYKSPYYSPLRWTDEGEGEPAEHTTPAIRLASARRA